MMAAEQSHHSVPSTALLSTLSKTATSTGHQNCRSLEGLDNIYFSLCRDKSKAMFCFVSEITVSNLNVIHSTENLEKCR